MIILKYAISYLIYPFKTRQSQIKNTDKNITLLFRSLVDNHIFITIEIGDPKQTVEIFLRSDSYDIYLSDKTKNDINTNSSNPYMVAKFMGVLLVLKKYGALEFVDSDNLHSHLMKVNVALPENMLTLVLETVEEVKRVTSLSKFAGVIDGLNVSDFNEYDYLRLYDYALSEVLISKNNLFALNLKS